MRTGAFAPPTDVCETESGYEIRMEIAGVSPDATEIVIADNNQQVTITGVRYAPRRDPSPKYLNLEIQYGGFARTIELPQAIDRDSATASYKEGLLVIALERTKPGARMRSVPIEKDA